MSRGLNGVFARLALFAWGSLAFVVPGAVAKELAPYRVALSVGWGPGAGSDAFRDDLSRSMAAALATGCFTGVAIVGRDPEAQGTDFVFEVTLSSVVDETRFDDSIAGTLQPGEPTKELRRVTRFEVTVDAILTARVSGALVNRRHLVAHVSRRPIYVGEDAQATARAEAIDDIVRDLTRSLGCGGAKLSRKIGEALSVAGQAPPGPR